MESPFQPACITINEEAASLCQMQSGLTALIIPAVNSSACSDAVDVPTAATEVTTLATRTAVTSNPYEFTKPSSSAPHTSSNTFLSGFTDGHMGSHPTTITTTNDKGSSTSSTKDTAAAARSGGNTIRTTKDATNITANVSWLNTFYSQSLWHDHIRGLSDTDELTPSQLYTPPTDQQIEIGKYVVDPSGTDFSSPKYVPPPGTETRHMAAYAQTKTPRSRSRSIDRPFLRQVQPITATKTATTAALPGATGCGVSAARRWTHRDLLAAPTRAPAYRTPSTTPRRCGSPKPLTAHAGAALVLQPSACTSKQTSSNINYSMTSRTESESHTEEDNCATCDDADMTEVEDARARGRGGQGSKESDAVSWPYSAQPRAALWDGKDEPLAHGVLMDQQDTLMPNVSPSGEDHPSRSSLAQNGEDGRIRAVPRCMAATTSAGDATRGCDMKEHPSQAALLCDSVGTQNGVPVSIHEGVAAEWYTPGSMSSNNDPDVYGRNSNANKSATKRSATASSADAASMRKCRLSLMQQCNNHNNTHSVTEDDVHSNDADDDMACHEHGSRNDLEQCRHRVTHRLLPVHGNSGSRRQDTCEADGGMRARSNARMGSVAGEDRSPRGHHRSITTYCVCRPSCSLSVASLFFPIFYGLPSKMERSMERELPQQINDRLSPNDRASFSLATVSVQENNLNRICLYKVGPCAVAFRVVIKTFEAAGMKYTSSNTLFNILWAKRATRYTLAALKPYQKVNHFPGTWGIGRKDSLAMNIYRMKRYFGEDAMDIVPASFILPRQEADLVSEAKRNPPTASAPLIYIVKPCASSCGRGIVLYKGMPPALRSGREAVCQRYIGNPLLVHGRKFDLRLYCVVTAFDPLRIYLFDEGLVRFAAERYLGADTQLQNIHMHLTNYSVNKTASLSRARSNTDYESEDPVDIKWCFADLARYLADHHPAGIAAWQKIMQGSEDVVIKTMLSVESDVVERVRAECADKTGRNCFELFGLDLMVDDELKVRLIEANIMPSLATETPLDKAIKARMLAHMLTLVRILPHRRDLALPAGSAEQRESAPCRLSEEGTASRGASRDEDTGHVAAKVAQRDAFVPHGAEQSFPEQFYSFGRHPCASTFIEHIPLLKRYNDAQCKHSMLTTEETMMLVESREELHCSGGFRRIFPHHRTMHRYLPFFLRGVRRNTFLLASDVMMTSAKMD